MRRFFSLVLLLAFLTPAVCPGQDASTLEDLEQDMQAVAKRTRRSVVQITFAQRKKGKTPSTDTDEKSRISLSGVILTADGEILSLGRAYHHVKTAEVVLPDGRKFVGKVVGADPETNVTLLKVEATGLPAVEVGDSNDLAAGSVVCAVGNPFGLAASVSFGSVSGTGRIVRYGHRTLTDVVQITTPVNPGDPGGMLADSRGRWVGLLASSYRRSTFDRGLAKHIQKSFERLAGLLLDGRSGGETSAEEGNRKLLKELMRLPRPEKLNRFSGQLFGGQGINFALPGEQVLEIVERLRSGKARGPRGYLGVRIVPIEPVLRAQLGLETDQGVVVVGVEPGSPAEKAGLQRFDVIRRYGGKAVEDWVVLRDQVLSSRPGDRVEILVLRKGEEHSLKVTLESREAADDAKNEENEEEDKANEDDETNEENKQ